MRRRQQHTSTSKPAGPSKPIQALPQPKQSQSGFVPAPSPTGDPASQAAIAVIRGWSVALVAATFTRGRLFALPSQMIPGADNKGDAVVLTLRHARKPIRPRRHCRAGLSSCRPISGVASPTRYSG